MDVRTDDSLLSGDDADAARAKTAFRRRSADQTSEDADIFAE